MTCAREVKMQLIPLKGVEDQADLLEELVIAEGVVQEAVESVF